MTKIYNSIPTIIRTIFLLIGHRMDLFISQAIEDRKKVNTIFGGLKLIPKHLTRLN
jgi:hypothetical protein